MKQKKFKAILINKYTIIKFFVYLLGAVFFAASVRFLPHLPSLSGEQIKNFASFALSASLPDVKKRNFILIQEYAAKAAGLEIFAHQKSKTSAYDPYPDTFIPVSEDDFKEELPAPETDKNIKEKNIYGKSGTLTIDNKTSFNIDVDSLVNADVNLKAEKGKPLVLIVHTHTTESYTPSEKYNYIPETNARTTNPNFNITQVGKEFAKGLEDAGINVIHDTSVNDYPSYNGSYTKTLSVIKSNLEKYPSIQIVIDIHRDSMTAADGTKYKVATDIDGVKTAQLMIIMGSSEGGLSHPEWQENLKLGLKLQKQLNSDYNNIARPFSIRKERFNTHATKGSMIVEVGTDANTLDEAILCAKYASKSFAKVIKSELN